MALRLCQMDLFLLFFKMNSTGFVHVASGIFTAVKTDMCDCTANINDERVFDSMFVHFDAVKGHHLTCYVTEDNKDCQKFCLNEVSCANSF